MPIGIVERISRLHRLVDGESDDRATEHEREE
jgi:hypothetical protein